ncbi:MAG: OmpH family outer membrane protein [Flavobacteriales bacterium]|nr:OmpH family outer membrane protein [Flavobacteriales bacterium]
MIKTPMKNSILTIALALGLTAPALAQTPIKLGHIDRKEIMLVLPERKDAETRMQAFAKTLDERLKAMGAEYQAKVADVQSRSDKMTQTEKEMAVREINDLEERINTARDKAQEDLAKQEEELLAPMVKRTNDAIKAVAEENNFTYVLDTSTGFVLYFDKGIDIMPLVKTKLGIN